MLKRLKLSMKKSDDRLKVLITGSEGHIGSILKKGLQEEFSLFFADQKKISGKRAYRVNLAASFKRVKSIMADKDAVIHLAWDNREDFPNERIAPANKKMAENVLRAAVAAGVKRIIIASSVHASDYSDIKDGPVSISQDRGPDTPYGASKLYLENLGRYFARRYALEVICVRFGGVNKSDRVAFEEDPNYDKVLLYQEDCIELIKKCLTAEMPEKFSVFYAVSKNKTRIHDTANDINWFPRYPRPGLKI